MVGADLPHGARDDEGRSGPTHGQWDAEPVVAPSGTAIVFTSDRGELFLPDP